MQEHKQLLNFLFAKIAFCVYNKSVRILRADLFFTGDNMAGKFVISKAKNGVKGAIFQFICDSFEDNEAEVVYRLASRDPETILLKASDYGVPQLRERLFLVGIRSDLTNVEFSYGKDLLKRKRIYQKRYRVFI